MDHGKPKRVNLERVDSLMEVNSHPPAITHWPRENPRIVCSTTITYPPAPCPSIVPRDTTS